MGPEEEYSTLRAGVRVANVYMQTHFLFPVDEGDMYVKSFRVHKEFLQT